jgi:hypothetical protein
MEFCTCGSLMMNGKCTNKKRNCILGTQKAKKINIHKEGFIRNIKTGTLIDKTTGTEVKYGTFK